MMTFAYIATPSWFVLKEKRRSAILFGIYIQYYIWWWCVMCIYTYTCCCVMFLCELVLFVRRMCMLVPAVRPADALFVLLILRLLWPKGVREFTPRPVLILMEQDAWWLLLCVAWHCVPTLLLAVPCHAAMLQQRAPPLARSLLRHLNSPRENFSAFSRWITFWCSVNIHNTSYKRTRSAVTLYYLQVFR